MDSTSNVNKFTTANALVLGYYIGLAITSFYGTSVIGVTQDEYDVRIFNCTCSSEVDFQCFQESVRTGLSIDHVKCDIIKEPGKLTHYEFCDCGTRGKSKCYSARCYKIKNPVELPEHCDNEECNARDGLNMWMSAAKMGIIIGCIGAILMLLLMCKAPKTPNQETSISTFYIVHLAAFVPHVMIVFSFMTTNVSEHYANVGLNTWASIMVIAFGVPLCIGWMCSCHITFSKAFKYHRNSHRNDNSEEV